MAETEAAQDLKLLTVAEVRACSGIFRSLSEDFLERLIRRFAVRRFQPGEAVHFDEGLLLLRSGRALWEDDDLEQRPVLPGAVFGEARLLGLDVEPCSGGGAGGEGEEAAERPAPRARGGVVVAAVLRRRALACALMEFGGEEEEVALAGLRPEAIPACRGARSSGLWRRLFLQSTGLFRDCGPGFLQLLATHAEDLFLAPGEALPTQAEQPSLYAVVVGPVHLEGSNGALLRVVKAGDTFGEAQACDLEGSAALYAEAGNGRSAVYVLRCPKEAVLAALHLHPEEHLPLEELVRELEAERGQAASERYDWISGCAAPALGRVPLLAGCPADFMVCVAGQSSEVVCEPGDAITVAGEAASHMFVVMDGMVELRSRSDAPIGQVRAGGSLGEVEALGMFGTSTVSAVAASDTRVLKVSADSLQRALRSRQGRALRPRFDTLIAARHEQVKKGLPLCALKINAQPDDIAVRTVALHSERLHLEAKELWRPLPDSDPCGPRLGILVRGRAVVELAASGREVMPLMAGSIVNEGILADFGARVRAVSADCEAYRLRAVDLLGAAQAEAKPPCWFYAFRLMEREASDRLKTRLSNTRGLMDNKAVHPCDPCIRDWTTRRQQSIQRAQENRAARAEVLGAGKGSVPQLPLLPPQKFGTTAFRSWDKVKVQAPLYASVAKRSGLPKGLRAYPCMRLPKISSEPNLRAAGREAARAASSSSRRHAGAEATVTAAAAASRDDPGAGAGSEQAVQTWELR